MDGTAANQSFSDAIAHVLKSEGGLANNPNDRGGLTKFGISRLAYPHEDISNLTLERAKALYFRDYWTPLKCDALPAAIRLIHFDCGVNCGIATAARLLQEALGVDVDGRIGPITIGAAEKADSRKLREDYLWLRARYYARITRDRPANCEFLPGWILRLIAVRSAA